MNTLHLSPKAAQRPVSTRALKTPFSPRLKFVLATSLVVLAAGLSPAARAMAPADGHGAHHSQHQGMNQGMHKGKHAMQGHHGQHGARVHAAGMGMGMGMDMGGMGLGLGYGRQAERALDSVGATPEQKAQIRQIGEAARADLKAQREAGAGLREQARALMTQPHIDANAVEALRQQMLAQHDQASRRMSQAMVEMARVLTPDQRQALSERLTERMNKRHELMKQRRAEHMAEPTR